MNTVDSVEGLISDVTHGRWDSVLQQISTLSLPLPLLFDIYEEMVIELIELKEIDTARAIMGQTEAMLALKERDQERYLRFLFVLNISDILMRYLLKDSTSVVKAILSPSRCLPRWRFKRKATSGNIKG